MGTCKISWDEMLMPSLLPRQKTGVEIIGLNNYDDGIALAKAATLRDTKAFMTRTLGQETSMPGLGGAVGALRLWDGARPDEGLGHTH